MKNIFVGNLDFSVREEAIRSLFENYGAVERVSLMTDRETGRSRGFGFVEMADEDSANNAIAQFNGQEYDGRNIVVNEARPREDRGGFGGGGIGGGGTAAGGAVSGATASSGGQVLAATGAPIAGGIAGGILFLLGALGLRNRRR